MKKRHVMELARMVGAQVRTETQGPVDRGCTYTVLLPSRPGCFEHRAYGAREAYAFLAGVLAARGVATPELGPASGRSPTRLVGSEGPA